LIKVPLFPVLILPGLLKITETIIKCRLENAAEAKPLQFRPERISKRSFLKQAGQLQRT